MHTETLLNPFYLGDYCMKDDGSDFTVFTQIKENEKESIPGEFSQTLNRDEERQKMDAVEDILLDDFSIGDDSDDAEPAVVGRSMSIDSVNLRGQQGKQIMQQHTVTCLESLSLKID